MSEDELVFRFVGYDELSDTLRDIGRNLERVADNSQKVVDRMAIMGAALALIGGQTTLINDRFETLNRRLETLTDRMGSVTRSAGGAGGAIGFMGLVSFVTANPIVALTIAIIALTLATSTLLPVVGIFVVTLAAAAIGLAGFIGTIFLGLGAFGAMTAGVILLADALFKAGLAVDPLLKFETALKNMALTWAKQAYPMAVQMIDFAQRFLPGIQALGTAFLTWFGQRIPALLQIASAWFGTVYNVVTEFAAGAGKLLDEFLAHIGPFGAVFDTLAHVVGDAALGLLTNLLHLGEWFTERFPTFVTILAPGFALIGRFIQAVGLELGRFVDFVMSKWPQAVALTQTTLGWLGAAFSAIGQGIRIAAPIFGLLPPIFNLLVGALRALDPHLQITRQIFIGLGVILAVLAFFLAMTALSFIELAVIIIAIVKGITLFVQWIRGSAIPAIQEWWAALTRFIGGIFSAIGTFFANLIAMAEAGWSQFTSRPLYWVGYLIGWLMVKFVDMIGFAIIFFAQLVERAAAGAEQFVVAIMRWMLELPGRIGGAFLNVMGEVGRFFDNLRGSAPRTGDFVGDILRILGEAPGKVFSIGADIVRGIWNGIQSLAGWIKSQAQSFVSGIVQGMKDAISSRSPSMLTAQVVGVPMAQGIGLGFANQYKATLIGMQGLMGATPRQIMPGPQTPVNLNSNLNQRQNIELRLNDQVLAKTVTAQVNKFRGGFWV